MEYKIVKSPAFMSAKEIEASILRMFEQGFELAFVDGGNMFFRRIRVIKEKAKKNENN